MPSAAARQKKSIFFASEDCHPQTLAVVKTRAEALGIEVVVGDHRSAELEGVFGVLVQYPNTYGTVEDFRAFFKLSLIHISEPTRPY